MKRTLNLIGLCSALLMQMVLLSCEKDELTEPATVECQFTTTTETAMDGLLSLNVFDLNLGWVFNRKWMVGLGAAALTNNIIVPDRFSSDPGDQLSYMYAQGGIVAEYIPGTDKKFHLVYHLFSGVGLTSQYERSDYMDDFFEDVFDDDDDDDERNLFCC